MRDLLVITPTRGRPGNMERLAEAVNGTRGIPTTMLSFAVDDDDDASQVEALNLARRYGCMVQVGSRRTPSAWWNQLALGAMGTYRAFAVLSDDHVPRTTGWDSLLVERLDGIGGTGIVYGNDVLMGRNLPTAPVVSADIVAALGWLCEPTMGHYCIDNVWKDLGEATDCLAYAPDVMIEHMHWSGGQVPMDATYLEAGTFSTLHPDWAAYQAWKGCRMAADAETIRKLRARP